MNEPTFSPPFGQADLTNCERELIHLAGSIQPHGVLLVADAADLRVLLASDNIERLLGTPHDHVLDRNLATLGGNLAEKVRAIADELSPDELTAFRCDVGTSASCRSFEGMAHLGQSGTIVIELEAAPTEGGSLDFADRKSVV